MHSSSTISSRRVLISPSGSPSRPTSDRGTAHCECSNRPISSDDTRFHRLGARRRCLRTRREVGGCQGRGLGRVSWLAVPAVALDRSHNSARSRLAVYRARAVAELALLVEGRPHHCVGESDPLGMSYRRTMLLIPAVEVLVAHPRFMIGNEIHGRCLLGGASFSSVWKVHRPRRSLAVRSRGRFRQYRDLSPTRFRGTER